MKDWAVVTSALIVVSVLSLFCAFVIPLIVLG